MDIHVFIILLNVSSPLGDNIENRHSRFCKILDRTKIISEANYVSSPLETTQRIDYVDSVSTVGTDSDN